MKIEISFSKEKETKGTVRYQEDGDRDDHMVGTLYVKKQAFDGAAYPETLNVTIES